MLSEFITLNRDEIIRRCRAKVATRSSPAPTAAEVDHGVPLFLDQFLVEALRGGQSSSFISRTALLHGHDLLLQGLTISQVVHATATSASRLPSSPREAPGHRSALKTSAC